MVSNDSRTKTVLSSPVALVAKLKLYSGISFVVLCPSKDSINPSNSSFKWITLSYTLTLIVYVIFPKRLEVIVGSYNSE